MIDVAARIANHFLVVGEGVAAAVADEDADVCMELSHKQGTVLAMMSFHVASFCCSRISLFSF
jgi:hypothetical protein